MKTSVLLASVGASWALLAASPAFAACAAWQTGPELSLRHAQGWTMLQLVQEGDRLTGTAQRPGASGGTVTGRLQPQRIWVKVSWPGGNEIFDGKISADGDVAGSRIAADGRQDGTAWEAMEPLQCVATAAPQGAAGRNAAVAEPTMDEFTRAARDIIGILSGNNSQPGTQPTQVGSTSSAPAGGAIPVDQQPAGGAAGSSDPFEPVPAGDGGGSADPFGPAPAGGGGGGTDPFGSPPAEPPPPSTPGDRPSRALPPSALEERSFGSVTPKPASAKPVPIVLIPIGPITDTCASGFVWREARPSDHVCVPPAARDRVKGENHFGRLARDPEALSLCKAGYVWRGAYDGDRTCVSPAASNLAAEENRLGPQRKATR